MKILSPISKFCVFRSKFIKRFGKETFNLYVKNFNETLKEKEDALPLNECFNMHDFSSPISSAFIWSGTPEGDEFWRDINLKWHNYEDIKPRPKTL